MNRRKLIVGSMVSILLLLGSSQAFAVEKITGAFGLKLGDELDSSSSVIGEKPFTNTTNEYPFKPKKPFRSFSRYGVSITPKTHLIYEISALGVMENKSACTSEQDVIMSLLEKKYGKQTISNTIVQKDSKRTIATTCNVHTFTIIGLNYMDHDLFAQAKKERLEIETKKVDSSGL